MRIAVLFSGRIDRYEEHHTNIMNNIVQDHNVDFFISTICTTEDLENFCILYNPMGICNEPIDYQKYSKYEGNRYHMTNFHNMMCMHTHRMRVFQEMERYKHATHTTYDLVISMRLDAYSDDVLNYTEIMEGISEKDIYIPLGYDWGGVNDQMAIGEFSSMKAYMNVYQDIERWLMVSNFGPETLLKNYLDTQDVHIKRFPFRYRLINGKFYKHYTDPIMF